MPMCQATICFFFVYKRGEPSMANAALINCPHHPLNRVSASWTASYSQYSFLSSPDFSATPPPGKIMAPAYSISHNMI